MQLWPLINDPYVIFLYFSRVQSTIVLTRELCSTMGNGTLPNFGKRYEDNLKVIFDQWITFLLGLDEISNQKILNGIYWKWRTKVLPYKLARILSISYASIDFINFTHCFCCLFFDCLNLNNEPISYKLSSKKNFWFLTTTNEYMNSL